MSLTRTETALSYQSSSGGQAYKFEVVFDANNLVSVRNVQSPTGLIQDSYTGLPMAVVQDIQDAIAISRLSLAETQVDSGTLVFAGVTEVDAVIAGGTLNNASFRVVYTTPDGIALRTTNPTVTGFTAQAATTYGTVDVPKTVTYVVLVATAAASSTASTLSFVQGDAGSKTVTFATPQASDDYRVVLSPGGFYAARVTAQTTRGFTVQLGHLLGVGQTATVGYDVFA